MKKLTFFLISSSIMAGELSLQGFSGLINTPNAQVIEEGDTILHFNNQFDNNLRYYDYSKDIKYEENYIFGVGFLPNLEVVGRLVEAKGYARDLSANIKYKLPYKSRYLPDIAIGIQDLGGEVDFYDNKYIVADKEIYGIRASIGYGKSGKVKKGKRMDGLFGGIEAKVTSWLLVMAENDAKENHAGVRLKLPMEWLSNSRLDTTIAQNLTNSDTSLAFNLTIPLKKDNIEEKKLNYIEKNSLNNTTIKSLFDLQKFLSDFGFEDVRVGIYENDVIYVECENSIFDKNDIDALGFIIGTIANSNLKYKYYTVTLLKNRLQTISVNGTLISFKRYIKNPSQENLYKLKTTLLIKKDFDTLNVKFIDKDIENSSLFRPKIELSPGILTTIGTEVGVFDYLISLRSKLYLPLYKGLVATAMYETPFANSDNFDEGKILNLMYGRKCDSRWVYANINQTFHYKNLFNTLSGGVFNTNYYGVFNQTKLETTEGNHAINFDIGTFRHKDIEDDTHTLYEGGYRYYYNPLDMFASIKYGKYWNKDSGFILEFKRFFGDTAISFEYRNLENQYVGAKIAFPLTLRKLPKPTLIGQIKGKRDFYYGLKTTVNLNTNKGNPIILSEGIIPKIGIDLNSYYLNRDRLNKTYILKNLERMREAYLIYFN